LENADIQRIQTLTTTRGFGYIGIAEKSESENLLELPYLAELWANPEVRWHIQDEITVIAAVPTPGGEHIFIFVRESNEWKLDIVGAA